MYDTFLLDVIAPPLPHPMCVVCIWSVHVDIWLLVQSYDIQKPEEDTGHLPPLLSTQKLSTLARLDGQ